MTSYKRLSVAFLVLTFLAPVSVAKAQGELILDQVHGESLKKTVTGESQKRTVAVYLPPSYGDSPERRYPVLYLLHGIGGTHQDWVGSGNQSGPWRTIQDVMDRGIALNSIAEMIVVAPNQMTRGGGSFYTNSKATGAWEDFTVVDLVNYADTTYRTLPQSSSRGIAGHSMGGYGAIKISMKHPETFQVVYGMNAALLGWAGDITAENTAYIRAAKATPKTLNPRKDFYPPSIICVAQAFSPNVERPPFYMELPFAVREGKLQPVEPVHELWTKNMPLYMLEDHQENLRSLHALRFDSGTYDEFSHIVATNRTLSERLKELSIPHTFEEYNGDHRNRLWGKEGRIATEVLPFFSRQLVFDREASSSARR